MAGRKWRVIGLIILKNSLADASPISDIAGSPFPRGPRQPTETSADFGGSWGPDEKLRINKQP
eukprot:3613451-Pyramimonas_sp.AAC.1